MNYKDLLGKVIHRISDNEHYISFITDDNIELRISKFEPYCACWVGEYIDEISQEGTCFGVITNIKSTITETIEKNPCEVYKGLVTFYFENGKLNIKVHGEDNGYYGVCFTMPVEIIDNNKKEPKI